MQDLAFSANSKFLATLGGQDDNALIIWDAQSGEAICGSPAAPDSSLCCRWLHGRNDRIVTGQFFFLYAEAISPVHCCLSVSPHSKLSCVSFGALSLHSVQYLVFSFHTIISSGTVSKISYVITIVECSAGGNYHVRVWQIDFSLPKLHPMDVKLASVRRIILSMDLTTGGESVFLF